MSAASPRSVVRTKLAVALASQVVVGLCLAEPVPLASAFDQGLGLPRAEAMDVPPARVDLGRALFQDPRLSADGRISCASCHDPARAFSDSVPTSRGVSGAQGTRNAPSLVNAAYAPILFWDGRRATLEEQAADPFVDAREHGLSSHDDLLAKLAARADYAELLVRAFPGERSPWKPTHVFAALAAYVRTLRAGDSAFDRYAYAGDAGAIDDAARRGLALFRGRARCAECHVIGSQSALFTDYKFHAVGIGLAELMSELPQLTARVAALDADKTRAVVSSQPKVAALGRFVVTKDPRDIGKYRTPSLRNVAVSAPYMHDGSVATLREAVDHEIYYRGVESGRPLVLTPAEREDLVAFLEALTSDCVRRKSCSFH